jgi:NAD(P)-dependent dehydrogenase (short-subunit alcohol dehydrogenase family)
MRPLAEKIAVVAGATRGAGRGIARALGEAGATVYCTGRSTRAGSATAGRPETIEETAQLVDEAGGVGIAVRVDHTVEHEVIALFTQIEGEQGRLDVLVNDVWGGDALTEWGKPFWELDVTDGLTMIERALHTHLITSRHGVPLMVPNGSGLVVEITDGDFQGYRGNLTYDFCKAGAIRLAYGMSRDLEGTGVTALAVTPGFLRSEAMLDHFGVTGESWREGIDQDPHFAESETPLYVGRAIAALAADPDVGRRAGRAWASWTLMRDYGFEDADGRHPDWGAHLERSIAAILARDGPLGDDEVFLLRNRRDHLGLDPSTPEAVDEADRIDRALRSAE